MITVFGISLLYEGKNRNEFQVETFNVPGTGAECKDLTWI